MRRIAWVFVAWLAGSGAAGAQSLAEAAKWDVSATAALLESRPGDNNLAYEDNWYFQGRYAAAIGRYWTEHLKTEVEYATSGEGSVYVQEFRNVDGQIYPYGVQSFHRLDQLSARTTWQFGHNAWVHPYINGGLVAERDRRRKRIPEQYQYVGGRMTLVTPEINTAATSEYRAGATAGAGVKLYMTPRAFFNTGVMGTWSRPATTINVFAGFGFDF